MWQDIQFLSDSYILVILEYLIPQKIFGIHCANERRMCEINSSVYDCYSNSGTIVPIFDRIICTNVWDTSIHERPTRILSHCLTWHQNCKHAQCKSGKYSRDHKITKYALDKNCICYATIVI